MISFTQLSYVVSCRLPRPLESPAGSVYISSMPRRRDDSRQLEFFVLRAPAASAPKIRPTSEVLPAAVSDALAATAALLPPDLRIGTSSWSFPGWAGIVYGESASKQRLARNGLQAYARHPLLRTVGIDRAFYAPVPAAELAAYAGAVPDGFRFLMKAHEACTLARFPNHPRYGDTAGRANDLFLNPAHAVEQVVEPFLEGLRNKAGPLLFQFPPQDLAAIGGPGAFADRLHRFLDALPRGPLYAVELRDARLLTAAYREALAATGACHCFNVHPAMPDIDVQAGRTGNAFPATVIRWMLGPGLEYEQARQRYEPFDRVVDEDTASRSRIAAHCVAAAKAGRCAYVIINNKAEGSAPLSAFTLAAAIAGMLGTR
jgi:uncharacterized protein YecE (DUF72 family)